MCMFSCHSCLDIYPYAGYQHMFCIEPTIGQEAKGVTVEPGAKFVGTQTIAMP